MVGRDFVLNYRIQYGSLSVQIVGVFFRFVYGLSDGIDTVD